MNSGQTLAHYTIIRTLGKNRISDGKAAPRSLRKRGIHFVSVHPLSSGT
jgi:hypothetical protein